MSIQEQFIPDGICYGCGPANREGLALQSYVAGGQVVADWHPEGRHAAVPGVLCGGVIGTLIDCHSGAALAQALHDRDGLWPWAQTPGWATAEYQVRMMRPTPLRAIQLVTTDVELRSDDAVVTVELHSHNELRAAGHATWRRLRPH